MRKFCLLLSSFALRADENLDWFLILPPNERYFNLKWFRLQSFDKSMINGLPIIKKKEKSHKSASCIDFIRINNCVKKNRIQ